MDTTVGRFFRQEVVMVVAVGAMKKCGLAVDLDARAVLIYAGEAEAVACDKSAVGKN